uniref:Uncharacterized protein n=1 Tax=Zea mays TaxID=4577 RepID=B6UCB3_MAIZE|nr:hypothetical protein [Zea mays]
MSISGELPGEGSDGEEEVFIDEEDIIHEITIDEEDLLHAVIYFALLAIFLLAVGVHIYLG